jgi:hypothetical protein
MGKARKSTTFKSSVPSKKASRIKGDKSAPSSQGPGENADDIFGFFAGKVTITGDIVSPAFTSEEWGDLYPDSPPSRRKPKAGSGTVREK